METTIDSVVVEIESNADKSSNSLNSLVKTLDTLSRSLGTPTSKLENLSKSIKEISDSIKSIGTIDTSGIKNIAEGFKPLQEIGKVNNLKNVLEQLERIPEITARLDSTTIEEFGNKIEELTRKLEPLSKNLLSVGNVLNNLPGQLNQVSSSVSKVNNAAAKTSKFNYFVSSLSKLASVTAIIGGLRALTNTIGSAINKSNEYIENLNLFYVSMGKTADKAKEFAENFSDVLGVDPSNVMRYMGMFNTLAEGFGISSEKAYIMSKNLTQLSYDMSSFLNIPIDQAMQKIKSGFSGEIEPMRAVGVALDQATLQETAYRLGIEQSVATMTRAQKTQLLYYQMMSRTTTMQGDMARTLLQPANAIRVLKEQFTLLARAIGNIFIPALTAAIPYVMVLTKWLTALAQSIANLFGFELPTIDTSGLSAAVSGLEDVEDAASGATKELKKMLAPFDELNVIDFDKGSSGGGAGGGAGAGDLDIPLLEYDALSNALNQNLDAVEAKLKGILPVLAMLATAIGAIKLLSIVNNLTQLGKSIGFASSTMTTLNTVASILKGTIALLAGAIIGFTLGGFIDWLTNGNTTMAETIKIALELTAAIGGIALICTGAFIPGLMLLGGALGLVIEDFTKGYQEVDVFRGASEQTTEALKETYSALESTNEILSKMEWHYISPSEEDIATLKSNFATIIQEYINLETEQYNQQKRAIENNTTLREEEKNEMLRILAESYSERINEAKKDEKKYNEELEALRNANAEDYAKHLQNLEDLDNKYQIASTNIASKNEKERKDIMDDYGQQKENISKKQASDLLTRSINLKNETIKNAKEQYESLINTAQNEYDEIMKNKDKLSGEQILLAEKTRDVVVESAKKQLSETMAAAEQQHLDLVQEMKKQKSDIFNEVDASTGEQLGAWQKLWRDILTGMGNNGTEIMLRNKEIAANYEGTFTSVDNYIEHTKNVIAGLNNATQDTTDTLNKLSDTYVPINIDTSDVDSLNRKLSDTGYYLQSLNRSYNARITVSTPNVSQYATGGFPTEGEAFIAREDGPELIGRIGNRTAVANNDQIIAGITQGVSAGVSQAMSGGNKNQPVNVYIGNKKVYSGYGEYANTENNMYGKNVIRV